MKRTEFLNRFADKIVLLDGATGTNLQAAGMPTGVSPEEWVLDNPQILRNLQENFYEAGSSVVYTFTFGANRCKLEGSHDSITESDIIEMNRQLALISCELRDQMILKYPQRDFYTAGDLAPTGHFLTPAGDLDFDEMVDIYRQQIIGLVQAGVDFLTAETMMDLAQTRAAVQAAQENSELPIITSVTVDDNGRTLSGNSFEVCLLGLAASGAQAVGMNCSSGPVRMAENIRSNLFPSDCLLIAKPNAGMPQLDKDGNTVFDLSPDLFSAQMTKFIDLGVNIIGGCCGTTPEHIAALAARIQQYKSTEINHQKNFLPPIGKLLSRIEEKSAYISSQRQVISLENWRSWPEIICNDPTELMDDLYDLIEDEPDAIRITFNITADIERAVIESMMSDLQLNCTVPIVFACEDFDLQKLIVRYYHGLTAFIVSDSSTTEHSYFIKV